MTEALLSQKEVQELTGYKYKAQQIQQLERQGITFHLDRYGAPKVPRDALVHRPTLEAPPPPAAQLNLEFLTERYG